MSVREPIDKVIQKFDRFSQTAKVSLFLSLLLFAAIPVTVMALYSWRTLASNASTSLSVNLRPSGTVETNPVFSWACYCQPARFTVYLREGNSNFGAGAWYGNVLHNNATNNTPQYLAYNNGFGWAAMNYPIPGPLKPGKTYYWTVASCDNSCIRSSEIRSFKTPNSTDYQPPTVPVIAAFIVSGKHVSIGWYNSTDNVGVVGYEVYRNGVPIPVQFSNAVDDYNVSYGSTYTYKVRAFDKAGNRSAFSPDRTATDLFLDNDNDGFVNAQELGIGTNPSLACGVNAWPPDFDNDKAVSSLDLALLAKYYGTKERRYDLNGDGVVNNSDLTLLGTFFGKTCS